MSIVAGFFKNKKTLVHGYAPFLYHKSKSSLDLPRLSLSPSLSLFLSNSLDIWTTVSKPSNCWARLRSLIFWVCVCGTLRLFSSQGRVQFEYNHRLGNRLRGRIPDWRWCEYENWKYEANMWQRYSPHPGHLHRGLVLCLGWRAM